jgi:O-antigen/teichoic acid export membrane protein
MSSFKQLARGVAVSWASTLASIIAGFVMAPFLIHHLGVVGYGVWVLIQSTISYMYLTDLGLRTAVIRFVARDYANRNHLEVSRIISAAIWVRFWSGAAVVLIISTIASLLPRLFTIPSQYVSQGRAALVVVGITFASTLVFSVFSATLMAIGRFDRLALLELAQIILTTVGLIPVVKAGYGLIGMAVWHLGATTAVNLLVALSCFRAYPQLKISVSRVPERDLLRALWGVGLYILGYNLAGQLIMYSDNLVVGAFVSAAAVAYYAVAGRMVEYLRQVSGAILKYFTPMASAFEARKQYDRLQQLQIRGTQVVLIVALPAAITLFLRGGTFFLLWIGPEFRQYATPVLKILVVFIALSAPNVAVPSLAIAMGKQKFLAFLTIIEGVVNLIVSVILARTIGIIGVAIGSAVPSGLMQIFVWPRFMGWLIPTDQWRFVREVWIRPAVGMIPFVIATYLAELHWPARNMAIFFVQTFALLPIAFAGTYLVFRNDIPALRAYMGRGAEPAQNALGDNTSSGTDAVAIVD